MSHAICVRFLAYLCVPLIGFEVLIKKLCGAQCRMPKSRVCMTTTGPSHSNLFSCSSLPSSLSKRAPFWLAYHNLCLSTGSACPESSRGCGCCCCRPFDKPLTAPRRAACLTLPLSFTLCPWSSIANTNNKLPK